MIHSDLSRSSDGFEEWNRLFLRIRRRHNWEPRVWHESPRGSGLPLHCL